MKTLADRIKVAETKNVDMFDNGSCFSAVLKISAEHRVKEHDLGRVNDMDAYREKLFGTLKQEILDQVYIEAHQEMRTISRWLREIRDTDKMVYSASCAKKGLKALDKLESILHL